MVEGKEAYSIYVNSQNMEIVVNVAPIRIDDRIQGAVLTFQEGRRIIEMDTELHKELYQRGFIANFTLDKFYTNSKETKKLEQDVRKIARYSAPVLIMGEKGEFRQDLYFALTEQRNIDEVFIRKQIEQILPDIIPGTEKVVLYKDKEAVKIAELLRKYKGNREKVASELGISKTTLWRHIKKYGIEKDFSF